MTTITDYSSLKDAVAEYIDRSDLTARIPTFIQLAEATINARFSHRDIESTSTLTGVVSSHAINLPTGYRSPLNLWGLWSGSAGTFSLRQVPRELMQISTLNSIPSAWCVDGDTIYFDCPVSSASDYTFLFRWAGGIGLSADADTNLVLENYPGVYLHGALLQAAPYLRDPEAATLYAQLFESALTEAISKEGRDKGLTTLSTEPGALSFAARRTGFNVYRGS